jgi:hypothetical protein
MAPADDALNHAIWLILTRAGLREASDDGDRQSGTGFHVHPITSPHPRAAVDWYEDGHPAGGPWDQPSENLLVLERALNAAGFQTELAVDAGTCYLLAWRERPPRAAPTAPPVPHR